MAWAVAGECVYVVRVLLAGQRLQTSVAATTRTPDPKVSFLCLILGKVPGSVVVVGAS